MNSLPKTDATVLIVEDEPLIRMITALTLEEAGLTVFEAQDADAAIKALEQHEDIQLLFTDVNMPGSMDGLKLAHYVRSHWPPVQIMVTSGKGRLGDEQMPEGAVFVGKPYRPEQIAIQANAMVTKAV